MLLNKLSSDEFKKLLLDNLEDILRIGFIERFNLECEDEIESNRELMLESTEYKHKEIYFPDTHIFNSELDNDFSDNMSVLTKNVISQKIINRDEFLLRYEIIFMVNDEKYLTHYEVPIECLDEDIEFEKINLFDIGVSIDYDFDGIIYKVVD